MRSGIFGAVIILIDFVEITAEIKCFAGKHVTISQRRQDRTSGQWLARRLKRTKQFDVVWQCVSASLQGSPGVLYIYDER